ncbi:MAG: hypothetical protein IT467_07625 [Dokdonella sp.]|nr:hypothetical protein [Dokdonella sp.]
MCLPLDASIDAQASEQFPVPDFDEAAERVVVPAALSDDGLRQGAFLFVAHEEALALALT